MQGLEEDVLSTMKVFDKHVERASCHCSLQGESRGLGGIPSGRDRGVAGHGRGLR